MLLRLTFSKKNYVFTHALSCMMGVASAPLKVQQSTLLEKGLNMKNMAEFSHQCAVMDNFLLKPCRKCEHMFYKSGNAKSVKIAPQPLQKD
jgi:hypothetical protein